MGNALSSSASKRRAPAPAAPVKKRLAQGYAVPTCSGNCNLLSDDLWLKIFGLLDYRSLAACAGVSSYFRRVSCTNLLWAELYKNDWTVEPHFSEARTGCNVCGNPARKIDLAGQLLVPAPTYEERCTTEPKAGWKDAYSKRSVTEQHWLNKEFDEFHLYGHRDFIRNAELHRNLLLTSAGSYARRDCSIRVWDLDNGRCKHRLVGHTGPVWSMLSDGERYVVSGSEDGNVRLWDLQSQKCAILTGHVSDVHCVGLDVSSGHIVSGSKDEMVHMWNLQQIADALEDPPEETEWLDDPLSAASGESAGDAQVAPESPWRSYDVTALVPLDAHHVHMTEVRCIQIEDGWCISGDSHRQGVVNVWNVRPHKMSHVGSLTMHTLGVNCLVADFKAGLCVVGDGAGKVHLWDIVRCTNNFALQCHSKSSPDEAVTCCQYTPRLIGSACVDKTVCMIDVDAKDVVMEFNLPDLPLAMQFDDTKLICGCHDHNVYMYDLRMRKLLHTFGGHNERVWAVAFDKFQLISAGLDGQIILRNFMPGGMGFQNWHQMDLPFELSLT